MPDLGTGSAKASSSEQDARLWRERYRLLFERNVAGIILTTPEGRIVDCNDACARIFGFDSREQMLAQSAWDFYFEKSEREVLLNSLHENRNCHAEEIRLRDRDGRAVWVLATRTVASVAYGKPELLQGTLIDITAQKSAEEVFRGRRFPSHKPRSRSAMTPRCPICPIGCRLFFSRQTELFNPGTFQESANPRYGSS